MRTLLLLPKVLCVWSLLFLMTGAAHATDYVWKGPADGDWNTPANWTPSTGFPNSSSDSATFNTPATTVKLSGSVSVNVITFSTTGWLIAPTGNETITLGGTTPTISVTAGTSTISVPLAGTSLNKTGANTLQLVGENTYTGTTTISAGVLSLGNGGTTGSLATASSIVDNGTLTINRSNAVAQGTDFAGASISGSGGLTQAGSGTTTLSSANTYSGATRLSAGTLNINNASALGTGAFIINGNALFDNTSGAPITLSTNTPVTLSASPTFTGTNSLNFGTGALTLSGANRTITVSGATATLGVGGIGENGSRALTKAGLGTLLIQGAGTYSGATSINAGTLKISDAGALGTTAGTTSIASGATLDTNGVNGTVAEPIDVNGTGVGGNGALVNSVANTTTILSAGLVLPNAARSYTVGGAGNLDLAVAANPNDSKATNALSKIGTGTLTLSGSLDNNNLSATMNSGTLVLGKSSTFEVHAIGLGLTINGGLVFYATSGTGDDQIDSVPVALGGGTLDLNGKSDTVGALSSTSGALLSTVAGGVLTGSGFSKTSAGVTILGAGATFGGGPINVSGGTLLVDGTTSANSALMVASSATLSGSGTVGGAVTINTGAGHAPGNLIGVQSTGNYANSGTLSIDVGGAPSDGVNVSGSVNLTGSSLSATSTGFAPSSGQTFTIINNDGSDAVVGTFAGLAQGSTISIGGAAYTISYSGGTGNDVVLSAPSTLTALAPGNVVISEFRLSGPNGDSDEFIELANTGNVPVDISGASLTSSDGVLLLTFGPNKTVPAGGHFLVVNSDGYSLGSVAAGNAFYTGDIALGAVLSLKNTGGDGIDSVSNLFSFSTPVAGRQYSFVRRLESGVPAKGQGDSNDFNLVDTSSTSSTVGATGVGPLTAPRLGAPGPQNVSSPIQRNDKVTFVPLNAATVGTPAEGRYASKGSSLDNPNGRLTIRRTITNNTGQTVTQMRFRIVAGTNGTSTASGVADLRALTSAGVTVNGTKVVQGITLDAPSTPTNAPTNFGPGVVGNGGGLNSSWSVVTLPSGGLTNTSSINIEFLFGIITHGNYRVVVDTELLP